MVVLLRCKIWEMEIGFARTQCQLWCTHFICIGWIISQSNNGTWSIFPQAIFGIEGEENKEIEIELNEEIWAIRNSPPEK